MLSEQTAAELLLRAQPLANSLANPLPEQVLSEQAQQLWIGIGCRRGVSRTGIETAIQKVCQVYHLSEAAIIGLATIDRKANESEILDLCRAKHWLLRCFSADQLAQVPVFTASALIQTKVGTPSVAEAAALLAAAPASLLVGKQVIQGTSPLETVAIAVAQAEPENTR